MNVTNCKTCGRLFNVITNSKICPNCQKDLEDKFQEVKTFLNEHPLSNIDVLSKECDVSVKQIKQWVREERLTFSEDSVEGIECEQCGKMIRTGKYCDECRTKIHNNLSSAIYVEKRDDKKRDRDRDRMRFLQKL